MPEADKSAPSSESSEQKSEQGPVWNPWEKASLPENPSQSEQSLEQASKPGTEESNQVPTPPPWPVEIKPPLPTNVSDLSMAEHKEEEKGADLSPGQTIQEQKPTLEPTDTEYHRQIIEHLRRIEEKLDKLSK